MGFPGGSEVKASAWNEGDPGLIPGSGRSPGEGNGNPLQYSCLENPMEGGAWQATVHRVAKSLTRLRTEYKREKEKRVRNGDPFQGGSHEGGEVSKHQETLSPVGL